MKTAEQILLEKCGCKNIHHLKIQFLEDVSITMILEAMEEYASQKPEQVGESESEIVDFNPQTTGGFYPPKDQEDERLDKIVDVIKSAWTPDQEPEITEKEIEDLLYDHSAKGWESNGEMTYSHIPISEYNRLAKAIKELLTNKN